MYTILARASSNNVFGGATVRTPFRILTYGKRRFPGDDNDLWLKLLSPWEGIPRCAWDARAWVCYTRHARQDLGSPSCTRIYTRVFRNHTQGDINMYSLDQQRKRRSNKKSPGFLRGVDKLWGTADLKLSREQHGQKGASDGVVENSAGGIDKEAFVNLMVKIHYLIICPPVRIGLCRVYFVMRANV